MNKAGNLVLRNPFETSIETDVLFSSEIIPENIKLRHYSHFETNLLHIFNYIEISDLGTS